MSKQAYNLGRIDQLRLEKIMLKEMVHRRTREINAHIRSLEDWITEHGDEEDKAQLKPAPNTLTEKENEQ